MGTKWKNRKNAVSFAVFAVGISLVLGNGIILLRNIPGGGGSGRFERILEADYQKTRNFAGYISGRLEIFLSMATGGSGLRGYSNGYYYDAYYNDYYDDGNYYEGGCGDDYLEFLSDYLEAGGDIERATEHYVQEAVPEEYGWEQYEEEDYEEPEEAWEDELYEGRDFWERGEVSPSPEQNRKIAERYHNRIKGDKNLIYSISYEGEVLYSNSDLFGEQDESSKEQGAKSASSRGAAAENGALGGMDPERMLSSGYNFLLYFDGEKVHILKDGEEVDVYGDGYYREENFWYVPGYRNFQPDEDMKKAKVYMAVAKEPLLYAESYGNGGYRQMDNSLYWMAKERAERRKEILRSQKGIGAGIVLLLLLLIFPVRNGKREAEKGIARLQAKIWVELKILLLAGLFYFPLSRDLTAGGLDMIWQELIYAYDYIYYGEALQIYVQEALNVVSPLSVVVLFWGIYLAVNDLRHNRKVWRQGICFKLYEVFSTKGLEQSLSRRMACRNRAVFGTAVLCGVLMLGGGILGAAQGGITAGMWVLIWLGLLSFLLIQYLTGKKNMETARELELLSDRIRTIHSGDYREIEKDSGHGEGDLKEIMTQLEDIRHGMASAVDEQMKSERMKVELIANVSHDIKTPLTSIISYVQFLKQEEDLPEHVKDYVTILDEKSQRLKNMVQDVFAVSKAASGELPMHMEALDFGKLLCQTMADMDEQIRNSTVAFRTEFPEEPVMILADGQRMYRVFQNLFQNAIQYSLDGSRVFVTLKSNGSAAVASVKNASRMELDKKQDFAERFTRGDQSRTDGGSGLGLSIAQSFTEACGGQFEWKIDADLFVVRVSFPVIDSKAVIKTD